MEPITYKDLPEDVRRRWEQEQEMLQNSKNKKSSKNSKYKEQEKKRKREERHEAMKNSLKFVIKLGSAVAGVGIAVQVLTLSTSYYDASCNGKLDFEERDYTKNPNVEAGYYNEHPISINISDKVDVKYKEKVEKAFKEFDKKAEGLSFTISYGDTKTSKADVNVYAKSFDDSILGEATVGELDDKKVTGWIDIDFEKTPPYLLSAVIQHEIGHVVGLVHSKNPHDLMFPNITRFSLSNNDIENINAIYPDADKNQKIDMLYTIVPEHYFSQTATSFKREDEYQMEM